MAIELDVKLNTKEFKKGASEIRKASEGIRSSIKGIGVTAGIAFAGFGAAIAGAVKQASKFEDISVQFRVLTGSAEEATKTVKELQQFAARTPFQFEGIAAAGKNLLAFGFQTEELIPLLEDIGDVAAATGSNFEELGVIFGQVRAAGKLTGERLLQLQERGIPILDALAKNFGKTTGEIQKMVTQGKISFADFQKSFSSLSKEGGFAFGGLEERSKTLSGLISTLGDNFQLLSVQIGEEFLPLIKTAADLTLQFVTILRNNPEIAKFAAGFLAVGTAIAGFVTVAAGVAFAIVQIADAAALAGLAITAMGGAASVAASVTGIGLLVVAVGLVAANWNTVFPFLSDLIESFAVTVIRAAEAIGKVLDGITELDTDKISAGLNEAQEILSTGVADTFADLQAEREAAEVTPESALAPDASKVKEMFETARGVAAEQRELSAEEIRAFDESQKEERQARFEALLEEDAELKARFEELDAVSKLKLQDELSKDLLTTEEKKKKSLAKLLKIQIKADDEQAKLKTSTEKTLDKIDKFFKSEKVSNARGAIGDLTQLERSGSAELKAIGKAASIAQITFNTAENASDIFKKVSKALPFPINIPAAFAAAGLVTAFGVDQVSQVLAANEGGLVTGGLQGKDSVPSLLTPGELVVPAQNFEEVIGAVVASRDSDEDRGGELRLSFSDNAIGMIEAELIERRNLNISQEFS